MIALDTSAKIGKSPKRAKVEQIVKETEEESENEAQDDESVAEESEDDEHEMSSAEELENVNEEESDGDADEENDEVDGEENEEDDEEDEENDEENEEENEENNEDDENIVEEENMASDGDGDDSEAGEDENESKTHGNAGWADAMQKILSTNKPKKKKTLVLSRAKKLSEIVPKQIEEKSTIEVVGEDGKIKEEVKKEVGKEETSVVKEKTLKRKRKDPNITARVKPSVLDKDREKMLQKIATKGVVQLFNAVRQQQTEISKKLIEAGPLERKRDKVMKNIDKHAFLDVLMGGTKSIKIDDNNKKSKDVKNENNVDKKDDKVWSVLRDDFVMGAKLKDWDKKAPEDDDDSSAPEEMDSD